MSQASVNVSENPTFKLVYFNVKAMAEAIRFLLAYGNQKYEDVRVTDEEWAALKPSKHQKYLILRNRVLMAYDFFFIKRQYLFTTKTFIITTKISLLFLCSYHYILVEVTIHLNAVSICNINERQIIYIYF